MDKKRIQIFAMILVGAGLTLAGIVSLIVLPAGTQAAPTEAVVSAIPARVDFAAPEIKLNDLQGQTASLEDYRGKVVLLNNWATWCPPCKAEMPTLEAYYQDHQKEGFSIIGIEAGEPAAEVSQFVKDYHLSFPIWLDPANQSLDAFKTDALPSSFVIDKNGKVRLAWSGPISKEMLEKYVTPLLEE